MARRKRDTSQPQLFRTAEDVAQEAAPAQPTDSGTPGPAVRKETKPLSVTQLTRQLRLVVESAFPRTWVEGEISNFRAHPSGHFYFTLKDAQSQIPAVMFRGANARLRFTPENGMLVTVTGSVQIYEPQGKYQIVCDTMEPSGIGALQIAFEQLKKKLAAEGLFDEGRKRPLPAFPRVVGAVTSESGAAIRDIINILFRRFPRIRLIVNPVPVQGEGAAAQIARAIDECNEVNRRKEAGDERLPHFDVLIVGRGGGSVEDLWAFNEEAVARAIARSAIPVISAVGHEIDWTIADFVADTRAPTPSAAAELVIEPRPVWLSRIADARRRVNTIADAVLLGYRRRVDRARTHYALREPRYLVNQHRQRVDDLANRLGTRFGEFMASVTTRYERASHVIATAGQLFAQRVVQHRQTLLWRESALEKSAGDALRTRRTAIAGLLGQLELLGPASVVKRGYTITRDAATGAAVTSARRVQQGMALRTQLRDGTVDSTVTSVHADE
ncbi:exodeoxyribonuclease VII large subunit [bacterium]|nr:exodeoxyribonuclease VII large subunit [bacterium]